MYSLYTIPHTQPYLAQLFEQYTSLTEKGLLTYSMKSTYTEGLVILKLVTCTLLLCRSVVHVRTYIRIYTCTVYTRMTSLVCMHQYDSICIIIQLKNFTMPC